MSMQFGRAGRDDIPALTALRIAYIREDSAGLPEDKLQKIAGRLPDYFGRHLDRDLFAFVCRDGGENSRGDIVGCCLLYVSEKPPGANFVTGRVGSVLNVYTAPERRRMGVGRRLMEMLLALARELELDHVELKATEAGYPLYRSLGFGECGSEYRVMRYYFE